MPHLGTSRAETDRSDNVGAITQIYIAVIGGVQLAGKPNDPLFGGCECFFFR